MKKGLPKRELFNEFVKQDLITLNDLMDLEDPYINVDTTNYLHFSRERFLSRSKGASEKLYKKDKYRFRFPESIEIIKRYWGYYNYNFCIEVVIAETFGRLIITYFQENILIEVEDNNVDKLKLCRLLKGTIIGDNKFINVAR